MTTYRQAWRNRSPVGWLLSAALVTFYVLLYWTESLFGRDIFQPVADLLHLRNRWYLYGAIYSVGMIGGAIVYLGQHGNSRYHRARITVNVLVQVMLGFTLPFVMPLFQQPEFYFSYFWPLKYDYLYPHTLQGLPVYLALYSVVGSVLVAPLMAVWFGKRWYCSWICGCGALANTFGDPWRHLTATSSRSWRFEQYSIHLTMVVALLATGVVVAGQLLSHEWQAFYAFSNSVKGGYGFVVGALLSGVVGTGLYPVLGPRVWCRNFCPMAAILGIAQKAGRFRIRVKRDMCISCGNCTTYCEMGIDVRAYAQQNQSFTRASCVGCGMCAHVCPRGVLRLETCWPRSEDGAAQGVSVIDF